MAHTEDLLNLVEEFPQAFADPESSEALKLSASPAKQDLDSSSDRTQQLLALVQEFPQAFADPEASPGQGKTASKHSETESAPEPSSQGSPSSSIPAGYTPALRRQVQTLGWGTVDFTLTYKEQGLAEIWVTVGKSGTEVQSLCEAIARLINLLLAGQVSIPEIVRQIRGIRGADSEGLGPHRILGLADLIGKVLQEAPASLNSIPVSSSEEFSQSQPQADSAPPRPTQPLQAEKLAAPETLQTVFDPPGSISASELCPDCGAELHQVNGCKGGACVVCGYSSCS